MYDEALEVLSDLWYGYAGEDIGPKMDIGDAFNFVVLLRNAGRDDEAAPIAAQVLEIDLATEEEDSPFISMTEGDYEEALRRFIERTKNGMPPIDYTGVRTSTIRASGSGYSYSGSSLNTKRSSAWSTNGSRNSVRSMKN
jgi:hypothetical protein